MVTPLLAAALVAMPPYVSPVHGVVVAVDRARDLVTLHHTPHPGMMMDMRMVVRMRERGALAHMPVGKTVHVLCDERRTPWVCVLGHG